MKKFKYLFLELGWFLPVIIVQWLIAPHILRSKWKVIPMAALPMAIYLSIKDRVALKAGTWSISEEHSTGMRIGEVPIEEIIFFIITSWVSAQGIILLTDKRSLNELKKLRMRLQNLLHPSRISR